jgi:Xaa-Pro dipeptidase
MDRRSFMRRSAAVAGAAAIGDGLAFPTRPRPLSPPVVPISDAERLARIEKARRLMAENGIAAMFLEPGSSMYYYTGVRWSLSERP